MGSSPRTSGPTGIPGETGTIAGTRRNPASASGNSYVGDLLADFCTLNASDVQVLDTGSPINTGE